MPYRSDIDGLRAIAVIGVLLFHADFGVSGGFIGVDVFFVISGFLITSLILKDLRENKFTILGFWERRARRILPALFVVTVATIVLGYIFLLPAEYKKLGSAIVFLSAFSSNIYFWKNTNDYFGGTAQEMPLLHTWSLSLEEQFYLIIPFALLILFRIGKSKWTLRTIAVSAAVSFAVSVYGTANYQSATFYLLPTRAWELAAGSMVAFMGPIGSVRVRSVMNWTGMLCILVPILTYDRTTAFPGLAAVFPVAGTAALIWAGMRGAEKTKPLPVQWLLSTKPLVWVGLLSYSLYLWHWPLLVFNEYIVVWRDSVTVKASLLVISLFLAWLSWRFIERPFRSRTMIRSRRLIFTLSAFAVAVLLISSSALLRTDGMEKRFPEALLERTDRGLSRDSFFNYPLASKSFPDNKIYLGKEEGRGNAVFFLWGDSHAMAVARAVDAASRELSIVGEAVIKTASLPVLNWETSKRSQISYNDAVFDYLSSDESKQSIKHVILAGRWWLSFNDTKNKSGSFEDKFRETIEGLCSLGYSVSLLKQVPQWTDDWHTSSSFPFSFGIDNLAWEYNELTLSVRTLEERFAQQNEMFGRLEEQFPDVRFIDPLPLLIDSSGMYLFQDPGGWIYYDDDHLSDYGALKLKTLFNFLGT